MNEMVNSQGNARESRKPWNRPTLQLLSANSASANTGAAGDNSPCPGADKRVKPTCS